MQKFIVPLFILLVAAQQISVVLCVTQAEIDENERVGAELRARLEATLTARNVSDAYKLFAISELGESEEVVPEPQPGLTLLGSSNIGPFSRQKFRIQSTHESSSPSSSTNTNIGFINPCPTLDPRKCCKQDTAPVTTSYTTVARYSCTNTRTDRYTYRCGRWLRRRRCTSYRTGYLIGQCTRTESRYQQETRCCPTNVLSCCLGFVYVQPKTINISDATSIELEAQCVTVDKFIEILTRLECLVNPNGCE